MFTESRAIFFVSHFKMNHSPGVSPSNADDELEQAILGRVTKDHAAGSEAFKADTNPFSGLYSDELLAYLKEIDRASKAAELEAKRLEDAFVEGKNCTTRKQMEVARREYRKQIKILARQSAAEKVLKV